MQSLCRRAAPLAVLPAVLAITCRASQAPSPGVVVRNADELRQAVAAARPGTVVLVAPGEYPGGAVFANLTGAPGQPVVIRGLDERAPPLFKGGLVGMQLVRPAHVELRDLAFTGAAHNGLNIDDGGVATQPAHHVTLVRVRASDVAGPGNHDGLKLSGVDDFRIDTCIIERWGVGGQGIDMVGCHRGLIEGCTLRHTEAEASIGVQAKGGSKDVTVRRCRFENAGGRAVQLGGNTGAPYFRPPLALEGPFAEAAGIVVEGCTFIGGGAAIAFVGVDGATARFNTIVLPERFALRILQENVSPGFVACRGGKFTGNLVVFASDRWVEGGVNVGPNTAPETFTFANNFWFCSDSPTKSRPRLPTPEVGGRYGRDPIFRDPAAGDFGLQAESPAVGFGADALPGAAAIAPR